MLYQHSHGRCFCRLSKTLAHFSAVARTTVITLRLSSTCPFVLDRRTYVLQCLHLHLVADHSRVWTDILRSRSGRRYGAQIDDVPLEPIATCMHQSGVSGVIQSSFGGLFANARTVVPTLSIFDLLNRLTGYAQAWFTAISNAAPRALQDISAW